jgi:hypothetical protein
MQAQPSDSGEKTVKCLPTPGFVYLYNSTEDGMETNNAANTRLTRGRPYTLLLDAANKHIL